MWEEKIQEEEGFSNRQIPSTLDSPLTRAATDLGYPSNGYALALEEGKVRAGLAGGG